MKGVYDPGGYSLNELNKMKNAGFDIVVPYNFVRFSDAQREAFLQRASEIGIFIWPSLSELYQENKVSSILSIVKKYKDKSAINAWYLLDEPDLRRISKSNQEDFYKRIKEVDPSRHCAICYYGGDDYKPEYYAPNAFDICMADCYPVGEETLDMSWQNYLRLRIKLYLSHAENNKDSIPVLQGFYGGYTPTLNPAGTIREQWNIWKEKGLGAKGYFMYAWAGGAGAGSRGIRENSLLLSEVTLFNPTISVPWQPPISGIPIPPPPPPITEVAYREGSLIQGIGDITPVYLVKKKAAPIPTAPGYIYDVSMLEKRKIPNWDTYLWYKERLGDRKYVSIELINSIIEASPVPDLTEYLPPPDYIPAPPPEVITTKTIIHTCKAKISYNVSSYPARNVTIYCPYCKRALAEKGIAGSEKLIALPPEVITTKQITCGQCKSILKVSISSYTEKNIKTLLCPICSWPAGTGIKVEVISTPFIDNLRKAIADLDAKITELEKAVKAIRDKLEQLKKEV